MEQDRLKRVYRRVRRYSSDMTERERGLDRAVPLRGTLQLGRPTSELVVTDETDSEAVLS